ncbi:MAG: hypothetical protein ACRD9R_22220 [Pyrinomonadaceae bacterium]
MSEDKTAEASDPRPFEERVLARFDALEHWFQETNARLDRLEAKSYDTKPIWENALKEIAETRHEMHERFDDLTRKVDVLGKDMLQLRADQTRIEHRFDKLQAEQVDQ